MDRVVFGEYLRATREKANMTQEELAEKLNIDATGLDEIERGVTAPTLDVLAAIKKVRGFSTQDFMMANSDKFIPVNANDDPFEVVFDLEDTTN